MRITAAITVIGKPLGKRKGNLNLRLCRLESITFGLVLLLCRVGMVTAASGQSVEPLSSAVPSRSVSRVSVLKQSGVEWHFDGEYIVGAYANGDPWVIGPVRIVRIEPSFDGKNHGWQVNPRVKGAQGFAADAGNFDASLIPAVPYRAQPGESLVKTIRSSSAASRGNCRECLKAAVVLTVVDRMPPDSGGSVFRPPYVGAGKPLYSVNDLRTDLLPSLPQMFPAPSLAWVEEAFGKVQLDHKG
ncbi:MAG: hypothetical protein GF344_16910, partial [Chitinivibrionales bacterium]|nr:hypothetical protein [Chitinivibrionales bacterium]MBD3358363.1 hypothetical protein [Chitinivibrionales bacterium]